MLQDYPNKELIIFNNHREEIKLSKFLKQQHNIRLINAGEFESISDVYNKALTYVDSFGGQHSEYVAIWDDDDIYLPWHLSNAVKHLNKGTHLGCKPMEQLQIDSNLGVYPKINAIRNYCEGCIVVKKSVLDHYGFGNMQAEKQHPHPQWTSKFEMLCIDPAVGMGDHSFVYYWGDPNRGKPSHTHLQCASEGITTQNNDTGSGRYLYPGATYYDFIMENLYLKRFDQEFTEEEKTAFISRLDSYDWRFFEERKLFTFWEGDKPYFIQKCLQSMEENSNCVFEVWDTEKLKSTFDDIPEEYDSLCVEFKSDYARQRVLYENGGMWLDADMFVVGDLYESIMSHTWTHDQVQPLENAACGSVNICAMACRPRSQVFKKVMESVNAVMPLHIGWGDLLNTPTKYGIKELGYRNLVKYIDESVISLRFAQSRHGSFGDIYKSTTIPLDDIVLEDTVVVTLHSSQIRHHQKGIMPEDFLLQRLIDTYLGTDELDILLRTSKSEYNGPCFEGGWSDSLKGLRSQQHPGAYHAFHDYFSRNEFDLIIELGTGEGGLTAFLATICPQTPIHTIDPFPRHSQKMFDTFNNIKFKPLDCFNTRTIEHLRKLAQDKKTCWLVDGNSKNAEFGTYSPIAEEGDVLMLHDFARNQEAYDRIYGSGRWQWHESGFENILNLKDVKWAGEALLENCVWGVYIKKLEQN